MIHSKTNDMKAFIKTSAVFDETAEGKILNAKVNLSELGNQSWIPEELKRIKFASYLLKQNALESSGLSAGAIAGIIISAILGLTLIGGGIYFLFKECSI